MSKDKMTQPEFGNETACANCGDEWSPLSKQDYCPECQKQADK